MIKLQHLGGDQFYLNPDLIKLVDQPHNTRITLVNGEVIIVKDSLEDVVAAFEAYQRRIRSDSLAVREGR